MSWSNNPRWSRRELMRTGALAAAGMALGSRSWAAESAADLPLIEKAIPSTGEKIPVIGIGTNAFRMSNYDALREVLKRMAQMGGRVIDTAALYGDSEAVIGRALKELGIGERMFLATKFNAKGAGFGPMPPGAAPPRRPPGGGGFPPPDNVFGQASFERSLQRLQTRRVDLLMAHFLSSVEPLMPVMQKLKTQGRTRYIGITTVAPNQHAQLADYMRRFPIDFVQVDYSLADRSAATDVFPIARERRIAVMVAVPLGGGRSSLMRQIAGRKLPDWAADFDAHTWSQFFLKYVVSHPAVTCAIPGSIQLDHLQDNQAAGHGRLPDAATRRRMEEFWDHNA